MTMGWRFPRAIRDCAAIFVAAVMALRALAQTDPLTLRTVTLRAEVPEGVGPVYLTGNRVEIGSWNPQGLAMTGTGRERQATLRLPVGTELEYKFTLGSWQREALSASGGTPPNHQLRVETNCEMRHVITAFKKQLTDYFTDWKGSGVLGRLEYWPKVSSKFLSRERTVEIWLPPGYDDSTNRHPVLYMHDGQNLFDPRIANTGVDWGVDEAVMRGVEAGRMPPLIVVGVWSTDRRGYEYSPWHDGTNYARFLIEELMPEVNRKFRTLTGPTNTGVVGSSLGGIISFWLGWKYPQSFGRVAGLSCHFLWSGNLSRFDTNDPPLIGLEIAAGATVPRGVRFYFDHGTVGIDAHYEPMQEKIQAWLLAQGLKEGEDFLGRKFVGADHNEGAWRTRLDEPLTFLFGTRKQ